MSEIAERLTGQHAAEALQMHRRPPSQATFDKCFAAAQKMEGAPMHGLAFIESTDARVRQVFTEFPSFDDWFRLERAAVVEKDGFFFILVDTTH